MWPAGRKGGKGPRAVGSKCGLVRGGGNHETEAACRKEGAAGGLACQGCQKPRYLLLAFGCHSTFPQVRAAHSSEEQPGT